MNSNTGHLLGPCLNRTAESLWRLWFLFESLREAILSHIERMCIYYLRYIYNYIYIYYCGMLLIYLFIYTYNRGYAVYVYIYVCVARRKVQLFSGW